MTSRIINLSQVNLSVERSAVHFGDVVYSPGGRCGPRLQQDYQLLTLHSGELELHLDGEVLWMEGGQSRLLQPQHREDFYFSRSRRTRHAWCSVKPEAVPAGLRLVLGETRSQCRWTPRLQRLFDLSRGVRPIVASPLETQRCLYLALHLLAEFAQQSVVENAAVAERWQLKLHHCIAERYSRSLRLPDLARAAGLSRQHLLRLCRLRELPSPLELLYRHRLEKAAELLVNTGLSIKEISEQCGFPDPFHFSRRFRQQNGLSPKEYRSRKA